VTNALAHVQLSLNGIKTALQAIPFAERVE
jgi:hypothetical protein